MTSAQRLEDKVRKLYESKNENRAEWADWLWRNHVVVVADYATELANRFYASADLSRTAALLHDIADVKMQRSDENHEQESLNLARQLMSEAGFGEEQIKLVVDDAIKFHSCHGSDRPKSIEGKILATADSLAHLKTNFYVFATWAFGKRGETLDDVKEWVLKKIERDFNSKILFDEIKEETLSDYETIKMLFSR
ncbi:HD domain-containing protein [Candidatus Saccharibacteria bacterium]|nr:HD domain-containing protein [Candidatus Saccharibacteria bacterium]